MCYLYENLLDHYQSPFRLILFVSRTEKTEATVVTLQHCQGQVADGKNWLKDDGSMENSNRDSQR